MIKQTGPVFIEALENLQEASHRGFGSPDRPIGQVSLDAWGERDIEDSQSVERVNDHIHLDEVQRVSTGMMRAALPAHPFMYVLVASLSPLEMEG